MTDDGSMEYWKLCERLTVFQATLLIIGLDPENSQSREVEHKSDSPRGYGAAKTALINAAREGGLEAKVVPETEHDHNGERMGEIPGSVDLDLTTISMSALRAFLAGKGFVTTFFSAPATSVPGYLNPEHPYYAPKLAAAVEAWLAVSEGSSHELAGTPKQHLEKWLRENAPRFDLTKADGTHNEDGIQQTAKIANWKPEGGAAKTPSSRNPTTPRKPNKTP